METTDESDVQISNEVERPSKTKELSGGCIFLTMGMVVLSIIIILILRPSPYSKDALEGEDDRPLVHIAKGVLRGLRERSVGGHSFLSFYAIPFARPPLGKLRFQDPVEEEAWTGVRNASSQPEQCFQIPYAKVFSGITSEEHVVGSEDCLYLNVFTPKVGVGEGLPVMVFLHGGGYVGGTASHFQPYLLLDHQVVLVVPQFRLGAIGFLSTEDDVMSGNYMLKDQLAALRWVHRHIHDFGGDPNQLTLFGASSGGSSTGLLSLSPRTQGLFSRVILQSGTGLSPFALARRHRQVVEDTARSLGYLGKLDSKGILSFLQTVPAKSLVLVNFKYSEFLTAPLVTGPRVDGNLIPADPYEMVFKMACPPWELMAGLTAQDGAHVTLSISLLEPLRTRMVEEFTEIGPLMLLLADNDPDRQARAAALFQYYLGTNINLELTENFTQFYTDYMFGVPVDLVALTHSTCARPQGHTFSYELTYRGERSHSDPLNATLGKNWVTHADDLIYLFPLEAAREAIQPLTSSEDLAFRKVMTKLWVNFAHTGNPTPDASLGFTWEAVKHDNLNYLSLAPSPAMKPDHRHKVREFYRTVLPKQNELMEKLTALREGWK